MINKQFDRIIYVFDDAPTPSYVSYAIHATAESILLKVSDFNGSSEYNFPFDAEKFSLLQEAFEHHKISNCPPVPYDDHCTGGDTDRIACEINNETVFSGSVYHCGGTDMGDLCGDIKAFARDFEKLVPEITERLRKHGPGL